MSNEIYPNEEGYFEKLPKVVKLHMYKTKSRRTKYEFRPKIFGKISRRRCHIK